MHHRLQQHGHHARHFAADADFSVTAPDHDIIRNAAIMPRAPWNGIVTDTGSFVNGTLTEASHPYFHGLAGVNQGANYNFANTLVASFFLFMFVTIVIRVSETWYRHFRFLFCMGMEGDQRYWQMNHSRWWPRIKKHLVYSPLWKVRHNREVYIFKGKFGLGALPTRYHAVIVGLYVASNIAYCLVLNYNKDIHAALAELRGRTGIMSALNMIPTVLFALRNNPLIPLLGVSYDTFNLLHRWCARTAIAQAVVHTLAWAANAISTGGQEQIQLSLRTSTSFAWGMVGTCAFGAILVLSLAPIRHAAYETFLNGHRLLVAFGLIGVYVHLDAANLPMKPYIELAFVFWGVEWAWRSYRIIYHNVSRKKGITKVTVEALPAEACRVTFELSRPWKWTPGCHVHMYMPALALWSSHPFSVAWAENRSWQPPKEVEMEVKPTGVPAFDTAQNLANAANQSRAMQRKSVAPGTMVPVSETISRDATATHVSLVCRAQAGLTRKMYERACNAPGQVFTTWGAIEGPYGGHENLNSYGTLILFAGGVGITHQVGFLKHIILQYQAGMSATKKCILVWSVPNTEALEWVRVWMDQILRMEGRKDILRIKLFITKPRSRNEVVSNTGSVTMHPGRCNPKTIIEQEMPERIGAMGVTVCGPGAFSDSVRAAVREQVDVGNVDFIEEAFSY